MDLEPQAVKSSIIQNMYLQANVSERLKKKNKIKRIKPSFLFFRNALSGKHDDYMMSCRSATTHSVLLLLSTAALAFSQLSYLFYSLQAEIL